MIIRHVTQLKMADDSTTSGPPPLDDGENEVENDDDDLFASASDVSSIAFYFEGHT